MIPERRNFKRYPVPEKVLFIFDHNSSEMAEIKDISIDGLKFEYLLRPFSETEWKAIDIYANSLGRYHLLGIPCKIQYEIDSLAENRSFMGSRSRISGLQFGMLTKKQKQKLASLLEKLQS